MDNRRILVNIQDYNTLMLFKCVLWLLDSNLDQFYRMDYIVKYYIIVAYCYIVHCEILLH